MRELGQRGREFERQRTPDPYPRPIGPAPSVQELRRRRAEIKRVAARHGARGLWVFGSVARGEAGPGSDLDVLVEMSAEGGGLLELAGVRGDLEELLGCRVHVVSSGGLRYARKGTRLRIEREAVEL